MNPSAQCYQVGYRFVSNGSEFVAAFSSSLSSVLSLPLSSSESSASFLPLLKEFFYDGLIFFFICFLSGSYLKTFSRFCGETSLLLLEIIWLR